MASDRPGILLSAAADGPETGTTTAEPQTFRRIFRIRALEFSPSSFKYRNQFTAIAVYVMAVY